MSDISCLLQQSWIFKKTSEDTATANLDSVFTESDLLKKLGSGALPGLMLDLGL